MPVDVSILPPQAGSSPSGEPRARIRQLLASDEAYATTLLVLAADTYGPDFLTWAPETIKAEMEDTFAVLLPKKTFDRLMAAITLVTTDAFYRDVARFIELANILAGDDFQPDEFNPADPQECAWAITEAMLISPPELDDDPEPFVEDIRRYIGAVLEEYGYNTPPDVLRIAKGFSPNQADFSDDPDMFQAVYEIQASKSKEVEGFIRAGLATLLQQIEELPVKNGSKDTFIEQLKKIIQQGEARERTSM